jgi:hypothetical protein
MTTVDDVMLDLATRNGCGPEIEAMLAQRTIERALEKRQPWSDEDIECFVVGNVVDGTTLAVKTTAIPKAKAVQVSVTMTGPSMFFDDDNIESKTTASIYVVSDCDEAHVQRIRRIAELAND